MPDRETRVFEFFFNVAEAMPREGFLLGGNGWRNWVPDLDNVRYLGHVYTRDHNAFNCTPRAVLNINRESMVRYGFSPPTRVFEAAGAGACLITDAWDGIEHFLEPDEECLVAADGAEVVEHLRNLDVPGSQQIGARARERMLDEHTYAHRAVELERVLTETSGSSEAVA